MQKFIDEFAKHGIVITPAGVWALDDNLKKKAVDAKRVDYLGWSDPKYAKDNMGRHFIDNTSNLDNGILVLDIDGADVHFDYMAKMVTIIDLDITIPYGLYTTTTADNKFHFYYRGQTEDIANRIKGIHNTTIDIFTHGTVFEGHTFAPSNDLECGDIIPIPAELATSIMNHQMSHNINVNKDSNALGLTSNIQRYNLVRLFITDELETEKQRNAFFRSVFPVESQTNVRKKNIGLYPLSYDLFNKVCVKLTTTSELDFNEHVIPCLHKLLEMWEIDPLSHKSQKFMWENILPSLPQHESVFRYTRESDVSTFQEHLDAQKATDTPLFFTPTPAGKLAYIEVDKLTQEPVPHNGTYLIDPTFAKKIHPERNIYSEEGKKVGWDEEVPLLYTINNPYMPQYILDDNKDRHVINLYQPTDYIKQVIETSKVPENNLIMKVVKSTIGPKWLELYLAYSAQVLFGQSSPTMVLWMSAQKTELGGSGKSVVTLELFSLLLGSAASAVDHKTVASGWGDVVVSTKILSLEDMPELNKEWETVYSNIKQQNTNSYRKLNMKGSSITSERVSVSITGSTNHRLKLSPSDRRFLCLEPAHFNGHTEPLTEKEQIDLSLLLASHDYNSEVQDYANYLYHIHNRGFSKEIQRALFISAPETEYRAKWVGGGESNTQNLLFNLQRPSDLLDMLKFEFNGIDDKEIAELLDLVASSYISKNHKAAVCWKWFEKMLPYVQSDTYVDKVYSKATIAKMLHIDFKNVGMYAKTWKDKDAYNNWPSDGYTFPMNDDVYQAYLDIIHKLRNN